MTAHAWHCSLCGWLNPEDAKACASCDKRAKKPKPRPVFRPWRCVVLALDAGGRSGWSVWSLGKLADAGEFNIYTGEGLREVVRVVQVAKSFAAQLRVPWVAMIEASWGGRMGVGLGCAAGYWKFALRNAQLPLARIGSVQPSTWRARELPKGAHALPRDEIRAHEIVAAAAVVGRDVGHDEAPAILIGKWGTQAGEVGELLPKNARGTI